MLTKSLWLRESNRFLGQNIAMLHLKLSIKHTTIQLRTIEKNLEENAIYFKDGGNVILEPFFILNDNRIQLIT